MRSGQVKIKSYFVDYRTFDIGITSFYDTL